MVCKVVRLPPGVRSLEDRPEADGVQPEWVPRRAVSAHEVLNQGINLAQDRELLMVVALIEGYSLEDGLFML